MKTTKRILSLFLALVMLLGMVPGSLLGTAYAVDPDDTYPSGVTDISDALESSGYIDIPIEILDFRGDGLLFEASDVWNTPYCLSYASDASISLNMSDEDFAANLELYGDALTNGGTLTKVASAPFEKNGSGNTTRIMGLVRDTLENGKLLYTEETLIYIAYALYNKDSFNDTVLKYMKKAYDINGTSENDTVWLNNAFYLAAEEGLPLGSPEDTYRKFSEIDLIWDNVETTFDMAHYMLSYVWNPVQENDYLNSVTIGDTVVNGGYNLTVPELNTLRLYKTSNSDGVEYYTFDSNHYEGYEDNLIYIANNSKPETNGERGDSWANPVPCFRPIENLGFEKYFINDDGTPKQKYKINTTGGWNSSMDYTNSNYLFTLHAKGGFVYYAESNFFFEFSGDDDVYFFINGKLVEDIGGIHDRANVECYLNDRAEELGLVDGQICTFDMYFADRHTTGVNMLLSTNIELMDYDLLTQKKQFDATSGVEYYNGRAVPFGTAIDYQFSILNRKELPASNVNFVDQNLGVELSEETIKLSSTETYTAEADLLGKGLSVIYTPYSKDGTYSGTITTLDTIGELQTAISSFTTGLVLPEDTSLPRIAQAYRYNVKTAGELMQILAMGIPGYCEFAVYGVERTLVSANSADTGAVIKADANGLYTNTLISAATPATLVEKEGIPELLWTSPVNGVSTCRIKGFTLGDVSVSKPMQVVLDYGKPVDITDEAMADAVNHSSASFCLDYVGLELPADNEKTSKNGYVEQVLPTGLLCAETNGSTGLTNGILTRQSSDALRFILNRFLEEVEHFYAVLSITPLDDPEEGTATETQAIIGYIYLEIQLIPANMMYYEAEEFTDSVISYEESGEIENPVVDYLFFDFNGPTSEYLMEYGAEIYGNQNWEECTTSEDGTKTLSYWKSGTRFGDNGAGVTLCPEESSAYLPVFDLVNSIYMDTSDDASGLNFTAIKQETAVEIRMKVSELAGYYPLIRLYHTSSNSVPVRTIAQEGEYVVLNKTWLEETVDISKISLYCSVDTNKPLTDVYIDYIYIGPKEKAPSYLEEEGYDSKAYLSYGKIIRSKSSTKVEEGYTEVAEPQDLNLVGQDIHYHDYTNNPDVLFFGFDNTEKDQARYASTGNGYGGYNYDDPASVDTYWEGHEGVKIQGVSIDQAEGAMKIIATPESKGSDPNNVNQYYPDVFVDTVYGGIYSNRPLRYNPKNAEIYQVRFKMKNFRIGTDINNAEVMPYVNMQYQTVASTANGDDTFYTSNTWELSYNHFHTYVLNGEQYVIMTLYNSEEFRNSGTVNKIRSYFGGVESISATQLGEVYIDYIYIGPYDLAPVEPSYGRDSSYLRDNYLSNGKSLYAEGNGVRIPNRPDPENYTEINFTFTGTGFDLITRTGADQGTLRVMIYKDEDRTKHVKAVTVNNKGELELYQIPTVSVQDLDHGTYYVTIGVNKKISGSAIDALNRGNQLYLDAIRIYDPIDVSQGAASTQRDAQSAFAAYCADGEAYPVIKEVREILLTADDFNKLDGDSTSGMDYVDCTVDPTEGTVTPDPGNENRVTGVISTYDKVGPKNEVYLSGGQAIAFKLVVYSKQIPSRLDIGCKIIDGNYVRLHGRVAQKSGDVRQALFLPIYSGTAQYYSLPLWEARFTEGTDKNGVPMRYIYVVLENFKAPNNEENTSGILSITDLKVAYDQEPTLPTGVVAPAAYALPSAKKTGTRDVELPIDSFVDFVVDGELPEIIDSCINDQYSGACDHANSYWVTVREPSVGQEGIRHLRCPRCGEILETETVAGASALAFVGTSVSLQSDLSIHYKVKESFFAEGGYVDPYVVINDNGVETVIRDYVVKDGNLSFVYDNIAPHRIGDTVTATLYAYYGDTLYCSKSKEYSVANYCYNMLRKYSGDNYAALRTLLVDILLYGAKSQEYMSYCLDSLCSSPLTEEQLAWGTELTRELVNHRDQAYETIDNPTVQWKGIGLNLRESVAIRLMLESESYEGLEVRITLEGETYTIYEKDFDYREDGTYVHFCSLNAAQMSEPIYVAAYRDGVQVSNTVCYSIESYAYAKQNDTTYPHLAELVERMMCYGDSCRAYIGK